MRLLTSNKGKNINTNGHFFDVKRITYIQLIMHNVILALKEKC